MNGELNTLVTDRLILRPPRGADAPAMAALLNGSGVARMTAQIPHPFTVAEAQACCASPAAGDLTIHTRAGELVGGVTLSRVEGPIPELGYWLGSAFWGQGLATEAVTAVLAWIRGRWGRRACAAGHFADDVASGRVLVKSDFLYTGEIQSRFSRARGETAVARMMIWLA